ncbi:MAG: hypothetical protein RLN62_02950 [Rickettsiales bacterium]
MSFGDFRLGFVTEGLDRVTAMDVFVERIIAEIAEENKAINKVIERIKERIELIIEENKEILGNDRVSIDELLNYLVAAIDLYEVMDIAATPLVYHLFGEVYPDIWEEVLEKERARRAKAKTEEEEYLKRIFEEEEEERRAAIKQQEEGRREEEERTAKLQKDVDDIWDDIKATGDHFHSSSGGGEEGY